MTDANGNSTTGVINVDVIDDVPVIFYPELGGGAERRWRGGHCDATISAIRSGRRAGFGWIVFDITEGQLAKDVDGDNLTLGGQQLYLHGDGTSMLPRPRRDDWRNARLHRDDQSCDRQLCLRCRRSTSQTARPPLSLT